MGGREGALARTPHHVFDHEMARGEGDGVGGGGDGQHEGVGAADGGGDHEVERVGGHPGGLAGTESVSKSAEDSLEDKGPPPWTRWQSTGQRLLTTVVNVNRS